MTSAQPFISGIPWDSHQSHHLLHLCISCMYARRSRLLIKVCCSVHRRNETLKFWHLRERSFVSFWDAASFFSHASPQYCHACRCSQDNYRGRPVSLPQFFRWLFIDAASPSLCLGLLTKAHIKFLSPPSSVLCFQLYSLYLCSMYIHMYTFRKSVMLPM